MADLNTPALSIKNKDYIGNKKNAVLEGRGLSLQDIIDSANKAGLRIIDVVYTKGRPTEEDYNFLFNKGINGNDLLLCTIDTYNITLKSP